MNLSESQSIAIIHAARPLQPTERAAFLTALETLLAGRSDIGDGELGTEAFRLLLNDERFAGHPGILETPKGDDGEEDRRNLATLTGLAGVVDASLVATP